MEFKLNSFLSKIGRSPIGQLQLAMNPPDATDSVYPLQDAAFSGSIASWVGRYSKPQQNVSFTVEGLRDGRPLQISGNTAFPRESLEHPQLPRLWARAEITVEPARSSSSFVLWRPRSQVGRSRSRSRSWMR